MWLNRKAGHLQDWITQVWVKTTGKKFNPQDDEWLLGPIGDTKIIKDKFFNDLAKTENLIISENERGTGLMDSMSTLLTNESDRKNIHLEIINFYEKTSDYNFEIWSEWCSFYKPFGKLLAIIFSRRLQQLNLPLDAIDSSRGINSKIIKLRDKDNIAKYTIWYRILKSSGNVIYSGIYTTSKTRNEDTSHLKVVFPLPNGNASVIMKKEVLKDSSLLLSSEGKKFGDNGFYFVLTDHNGKYWAKFVKSMHEWIHVYVDEENVLRTNHTLHFYGRPFLKLHYKMTKKA
jgi:hypothetical protein